MFGWFWNRVERVAARHATVWPSQHAVHNEIMGQLLELQTAVDNTIEIMNEVDFRLGAHRWNPCPTRDEWDRMRQLLGEPHA
jgi:hypothetical protein